jgi:hypothetical protein
LTVTWPLGCELVVLPGESGVPLELPVPVGPLGVLLGRFDGNGWQVGFGLTYW